jgi:hypothetical protein
MDLGISLTSYKILLIGSMGVSNHLSSTMGTYYNSLISNVKLNQ